MDFLDYREKLGIGFCDEEKFKYFLVRIYNILNMIAEDYSAQTVDPDEYAAFCDLTGIPIDYAALNDAYTCRERYRHCLATFDRHKTDMRDFLSYYVAFANSVKVKKENDRALTRVDFIAFLTKALETAHIQFEIMVIEGEAFIFPKGAKELDDALVSQPLEWLKDYSSAQKAWIKALKDYSEAIDDNASDVADKFRKALETFFQEFFTGNKSLENYKAEYGKYLKNRGIPKEISGNFETLLQSYTQFMNNYAKHRDATSDKVLEYIMYQTGNIIRLLITLKQEEQADAD